jgi:Zn finger protein HypA/HybF involved in hydrogenase expression
MMNEINRSEKNIQCPNCEYKYLKQVKNSSNNTVDIDFFCPFCLSKFNKSLVNNENHIEEINDNEEQLMKNDEKHVEKDYEEKTGEFNPFVFK